MKLVIALSALLLPAMATAVTEAETMVPVTQYDLPGGKLAGCFFAKTFQSGTAISESGVEEDFTVVEGAEVRCFTGCFSGGQFTTAYNFGGATTGSGDTDGTTEENEFCESTTKFTATSDQTTLGWSITTDADYIAFAITCFCTDDGSDFTLDAGQGILDDIEAGDGCFSESASVQVQGKGEVVAMKDLVLGDKVLIGKNTYEPVYSFGHRKPEFQMEFYQIYTDEAATSSSPLEMTGNHMIMVVDDKGQTHATRADHLQVGDHLMHVDSQKEVTVTVVKTAQKNGLYMPLTPSGQIAVNGVLASNYISISDTAPGVVEHSQMFFPMNEQTLSHWWMSPLRMLCMGVSSSFCSSGDNVGSSAYELQKGDEGILPWLLIGRHFAHVAENQPTIVRFMFGVPTFLLFGLFNTVEHVFLGPSYAPFLFIMVIALALIIKKKLAGSSGSEFERDAGYSLLGSIV